jgi:hypothetical protein
MTDEEAIAYVKRLYELEEAGERTTIVIGPASAFSLIGMLQLVTRHPSLSARQLAIARSMIDDLRSMFKGTLGEEIIARGDNPVYDRPTRGKKPRRQ